MASNMTAFSLIGCFVLLGVGKKVSTFEEKLVARIVQVLGVFRSSQKQLKDSRCSDVTSGRVWRRLSCFQRKSVLNAVILSIHSLDTCKLLTLIRASLNVNVIFPFDRSGSGRP